MGAMTDTATCHVCGYAFAPEQNACGGCAMNSDCGLIKCPNCGTETPNVERGLAGLLQRWFARREGKSFDA